MRGAATLRWKRRSGYSDLWGCIVVDKRRTPGWVILWFSLILSLSLAKFKSFVSNDIGDAVWKSCVKLQSEVSARPSTTPKAFCIRSYVAQRSLGGSRVVTFLRPTHKRSFNERRREIQETPSRHLRGNETQTQAVFRLRERPSARRGPGIVSVDRNVRSKSRCSCVLQFTR